MFKKIYLGILFLLFLIFIYLVIITVKPIRNVSAADVSSIKGIVTSVEDKNGDLLVTLENDPHLYYVKSFKKHQLDFSTVQQAILKKEITLHHINKWTPFTRDRVYPHISKIEVEGRRIFNEIKE